MCPHSNCKLMLVAPTVTQEYVVTCHIGTFEPQTLITEPLINERNSVSSFL